MTRPLLACLTCLALGLGGCASAPLVAVIDTGRCPTPVAGLAVEDGVNLLDPRRPPIDRLQGLYAGHGEAMAYLAAAESARLGRPARVRAYRVAPPGGARASDVAAGIRAAAADGADVILLALTAPRGTPELAEAVAEAQKAGAAVVASAGNFETKDSALPYPAAYPGVMAVAEPDPSPGWSIPTCDGAWRTMYGASPASAVAAGALAARL